MVHVTFTNNKFIISYFQLYIVNWKSYSFYWLLSAFQFLKYMSGINKITGSQLKYFFQRVWFHFQNYLLFTVINTYIYTYRKTISLNWKYISTNKLVNSHVKNNMRMRNKLFLTKNYLEITRLILIVYIHLINRVKNVHK